MNCQALINEFLDDFHAGKLSLARKLEFELHLALCRDCRRYVDAYRKTVSLARAAERDASAPEAPAELVAKILELTGSRPGNAGEAAGGAAGAGPGGVPSG